MDKLQHIEKPKIRLGNFKFYEVTSCAYDVSELTVTSAVHDVNDRLLLWPLNTPKATHRLFLVVLGGLPSAFEALHNLHNLEF